MKIQPLGAPLPPPPNAGNPYLFLMSGLPGSGKSTAATMLEARYRAIVLTLDQILVPLFGAEHLMREPALRLQRVNAARASLWRIARQILSRDISVILDDGFFTRNARHNAITSCQPDESTGIICLPFIVFCDAPLTILASRLTSRNKTLPPYCHLITPEFCGACAEMFEPPVQGEGNVVIFRHEKESQGRPWGD